MKIAFVGLGSMGAPLARLIARAGHELNVHDAFPAACEAFRDIARIGTSAADAARGVQIACVCVRDDRQVEDAVLGEAGLVETLAADSLLLVHSTIRIDTLQRLHLELGSRGIALVDAPVSRTRATEDEAFVFTMMGGETGEVERARAVVDAFSTEIGHMGPLGAGMAAKIANNLITWTHLVVAGQASRLAAAHGVAHERLRRVMAANGNLTPTVAALLDGKRASPPGVDMQRDRFLVSQAGIGEKDLELAIACCESTGIETAMVRETRKLVRPVMTGALPGEPHDRRS